ncbi:MAG: CopG family transcriptional regulator [Desulfohalobiaceae bacterium]
MSQVTIYLDPETDRKLQTAVKAAGTSKSKWVAELIRREVAGEWPDSIRALAGAWPDLPDQEEIRSLPATDVHRESL